MEEIDNILEMLAQCKEVALKATIAYSDLRNHSAAKLEGLPELLRAQEQNAMALIVQAEKLWSMVKYENTRK